MMNKRNKIFFQIHFKNLRESKYFDIALSEKVAICNYTFALEDCKMINSKTANKICAIASKIINDRIEKGDF